MAVLQSRRASERRRGFGRPRRSGVRWWAIGAVTAAVALFQAGCTGPAGGRPVADQASVPDTGATISLIAERPRTYFGKTVTVSGEVDRVYGPHAFLFEGDQFVGGADLLVVTRQPLPAVPGRPADAPLRAGDIVQVTGLVRPLDAAALQRELGVDLPTNLLLAELADRPVVVARTTAVTARAR